MANVNHNFAKPDADMRPVFAPAVFRYNGKDYWHPEKEDFALVGYLPLSPDWPVDPPQGQHYERTSKIEPDGDGGYRWTYRLVDDPPPPPREFSKLKVVAALTDAGVWQQVKTYIEQNGLYDLYLAAQDFREDNPYFLQGLAALKPVVGWTDEQVEALLSQCVKEDY